MGRVTDGVMVLSPVPEAPSPAQEGREGSRRSPNLGEVVRAFTALTPRQLRSRGMRDCGWQRNSDERVVRDEEELNRVRQYLTYNPASWANGLDDRIVVPL